MMKENYENLEQLRKKTLELLENNFAHDVITVDEYEKRVDIALNTSISEDLIRISSDLILLSTNKPSSDTPPAKHRKQDDLIVGILSGIKRRSPWKPAKHNKIFTVMGGVDLDFTEVKLPSGTTTIEFFCIMGGLDIIVPEGIRVDLAGLPIMGGIENHITDPEDPDCPVLKVRGIVLLGGVEVKPPRKRRKWRRHR